MKKIIEIITTGDEILSGITQDSNFYWLCENIFARGLKIDFHQCIGDDLDNLVNSLDLALSRSNIIIFTGGLGPTSDDLTREAASKFFGMSLKYNKKIENKIKEIFKRRKRKYSNTNKKQSYFPEGSKIISNPFGTADGFLIKKNKAAFYFYPGVPKELKAMVEISLFKDIEKIIQSSKNFMNSEMLKIYGLPESEVADKIKTIKSNKTQIGYRPNNFEIHLRLNSFGKTKKDATLESTRIKKKIYKKLNQYIFSDDDTNLPETVFQILLKKRKKISFAESCTGGMISNSFTDIPGSSRVYGTGVNTYSNESKSKILNVPKNLLSKYGAVSRQVVRSMVINLVKISGSDIGVAISGIAGPGGGSKEKPVGTVFAAYYIDGLIKSKKYFFTGTRKTVKLMTTLEVFDYLRRNIK